MRVLRKHILLPFIPFSVFFILAACRLINSTVPEQQVTPQFTVEAVPPFNTPVNPAPTYSLSLPAIFSPNNAAKSVPPQTPSSWPPCIPSHPPETAQVIEVVDGDTIHVLLAGKTYKVRYIGLDAPENTTQKEPFGAEATERNRKLVAGRMIQLVKDVSETDRSGRLLRYVFVGDVFVNLSLVQEGYAQAKSYPPDTACDQVLKEAEQNARQWSRGLWAFPVATALSPTQVSGSRSGGSCDPAYPEVCIPSPPPDLDCADISFRSFKVLAPDPHHFDMDHNGVGCEGP
jgi:micrococcal nuclease